MRLKPMSMISMFIMLLLIGQSITSHLDQIPGEDRSTELESKTIVMHSNNSTDSDTDGVMDIDDDCPNGSSNWASNYSTDHDSDGCQDNGEDADDDNDGLLDAFDDCPKGDLNWSSNSTTDHDSDGCQDNGEDTDDDNDGVVDIYDSCPKGDLNWNSNNNTDADEDGCQDSTEDYDGGNNTSGNDAHCLTIGNVSMTSTYLLSFDLVNICPIQMNYPGVNASADHAGVSGLPNTYSWWFYAIGPNGSYNFSFQLSFDENVSNNTVVNLIINPTILNCGGNTSWHQCPNSSANYTFTYIQLSNNSGGNNSGGNNTGGNNTGGNNTGGNQTSPCGSNVNYTSVYAYAPYMVMENQSFMTSIYVNCEILNASMMLDYSIINSNNSTVYSGSQSWNGTNSSSSNFTSSVPGLPAEYYIFHADLYVDGTLVDSDYDWFNVYANSGGENNTDGNNSGEDDDDFEDDDEDGAAGNNTGGNNTGSNNNNQTGCGYTMENSSIYVYQNNPWMNSGEYLSFSAYVDCMVIGETIEMSYTLELQDNTTNQITLIEQSSNTWIVNNISSVYSFQTGVLYGGAYALTTTLTYSDSSLTVDSSSFTFGISMADSDGDGIENMFDNCRNRTNPAQQDLDGDGMGDACDSDIDNDNVANEMDAFPYNASEQYDTDGDGIGNNVDNDDDNDGLADYSDAFPLDASEQMDSDGDGIGNNADADDDGDGVIDALDNCPLNPNANQSDGDSDGFGTVCDINEGPGNVDSNSGNNISNNVTIDAEDVSSLPSLGVLGTLLAVSVGFIAMTRRFEDE